MKMNFSSHPSATCDFIRRKFFRFLRIFLLLASVIFFLVQIQVLVVWISGSSVQNGKTSKGVLQYPPYTIPPKLEKFLEPPVRANSSTTNTLSVTELRHLTALQNELQIVHNEDIFGPVTDNTTVIVIQVHTRLYYLKYLILSLANAASIAEALLIFSHDVYDDELNEIVQRIDFCRYMQIFYPYSIQMYPSEFPGENPKDCPRNAKKDEAERLGCTNAAWPDHFGHYREASVTQTKHHWWWKVNHVFDGINVLKEHPGPFIFLEEDHFVVEDFLHVFHKLLKIWETETPEAQMITLGNYLKKQDQDGNIVDFTDWLSGKHNMGMAFGRRTWRAIKECSEPFCTFDDYNWDFSLMYINTKCLSTKMRALVMRSTRVFHLGECGIHHKKKLCDVMPLLEKSQAIVKTYRQLYPTTMAVRKGKLTTKVPKTNGGWGDIRDHNLCLNISQSYNQR